MPEFVIPSSLAALFPNDSENALSDAYVCEKHEFDLDNDADDIVTTINDYTDRLSLDPLSFAEHDMFDYYASVTLALSQAQSSSVTVSMIVALQSVLKAMVEAVRNDSGSDSDSDAKLRTAIKMAVYLVGTIIDAQEKSIKLAVPTLDESHENSYGEFDEGTGKHAKGRKSKVARPKKAPARKSKKAVSDDIGDNEGLDWTHERGVFLLLLLELFDDDAYYRLYHKQPLEEKFGYFAMSSLLTTLPALVADRGQSTNKSLVANLVSVVNSRFDLSHRLAPLLISLIVKNESLVTVTVAIIETSVSRHKQHSLIAAIIREFGELDGQALLKDTSGARGASTLLVELSVKLPEAFRVNLPLIEQQLDHEAYIIRNGCVQIIGELLKSTPIDTNTDADSANDSRLTLFSLLCQRVHDVAAFTRSKTLQTLLSLSKSPTTLTKQEFEMLSSLATDRIHDTSSHVRKYAMQLLASCLSFNRIGPVLTGTQQRKATESLRQKLNAKLDARRAKQVEQAAQILSQQQQEEHEHSNSDIESVDSDDDSSTAKPQPSKTSIDANIGSDSELKAQHSQLLELESSVNFIASIEQSIPKAIELLQSQTNTDIIEACSLLVTAQQFQMNGSSVGVRSMLKLIWSREPSIREAVIMAYQSLYIGDRLTDVKGPTLKKVSLLIAQSLIELALGATLGELNSLEELLTKLVHSGNVSDSVVSALCDIVSVSDGISVDQRCAGLALIAVFANTGNGTVMESLPTIIATTIGSLSALSHPHLVQWSVSVIVKAIAPKFRHHVSKSGYDRTAVTAMSGSILNKLELFLTDTSVRAGSEDWYAGCQQCLSLIFSLSSQPEAVMQKVIGVMTKSAIANSHTRTESTDNDSGSASIGNAEKLARLFHLLGESCLHTLIRIEKLDDEIKSLRRKKQSEKENTNDNSNNVKAKSRGTSKVDSKAPPSSLEDDLAVNASEELELEQLREFADRSLVESTNDSAGLLTVYLPLLLTVINQPSKYNHERLQCSAVMCLCRLMCASARLCDQYLTLVFTVLEQSPHALVRANLVIAVGDLASRQPNLVEPWSVKLFSRLGDNSSSVAINTMLVLSHLTLSDWMKVRRGAPVICAALTHPNDRIKELAKLFIEELSKKSKSSLTRVMPAIISHCESVMDEDSVRAVIAYIEPLIEKEKQSHHVKQKLASHSNTSASANQVEVAKDAVTVGDE